MHGVISPSDATSYDKISYHKKVRITDSENLIRLTLWSSLVRVKVSRTLTVVLCWSALLPFSFTLRMNGYTLKIMKANTMSPDQIAPLAV